MRNLARSEHTLQKMSAMIGNHFLNPIDFYNVCP
jgi:hypothetical protein